MTSIQELDSETLVLRARDSLAIVVVNIEVLTCIDECKVLNTLNDSVDNVFDIENEW